MTASNLHSKIALVCSLPYGKGGMESMISTLVDNAALVGEVKTFFFDFHNALNKNFFINNNVCLPNPKFPRIIQELCVVSCLRSFLSKYAPDSVICLDEKSCQLAYYSSVFLPTKTWILGSWLHRSMHTYKKTSFIKKMDFHLAISNGIKSQLENIGIDPKKISLLPNCNTATYSIPSLPDTLSLTEKIHFIYIGRVQFDDQKNLKDLFSAFARLKLHCHLDIIGDGTSADIIKCKNLCIKLGILNKVTFHGWQSNAWKYLENAKIYNIAALCLTSTYEGFPLVLIEAISQGIFCISSDCQTGPRDIIHSGNGILYPTGNIEKLAQAMNLSISTHIDRTTIRKTAEIYSKDKYLKKINQILLTRHA